eukprot:m.7014 g.7014  ORF g.7014 m.7014 type:complete len:924 (-) comp3630_c0_seq1:337-3108(-)
MVTQTLLALCFLFANSLQVRAIVKCNTSAVSVVCINLGLTEMPEFVNDKTDRLRFYENQITEITVSHFANLPLLEYLYVYDNNLSYLEPGVFQGKPRARYLDFRKNHLKKIDNGMLSGLEVANIRLLNFAENQLTSIESGFLGLDTLWQLHLFDNLISVLTNKSFEGLEHLEYLDLSKNKISTISRDVWNPMRNYLHTLNLNGNLLREILPEYFSTPLLTSLDISSNEISMVYENAFVELPILKNLRLDGNKLTIVEKVFEGLFALSTISLSDNLITRIAPGIFDKSKHQLLEKIDLSGNLLTEIPSLCINGFTNLELNLGNNKITHIPEWAFEGIESFTLLDLSSNGIVDFSPQATFPLTQTLDLQGNNYISLPLSVEEKLNETSILATTIFGVNPLAPNHTPELVLKEYTKGQAYNIPGPNISKNVLFINYARSDSSLIRYFADVPTELKDSLLVSTSTGQMLFAPDILGNFSAKLMGVDGDGAEAIVLDWNFTVVQEEETFVTETEKDDKTARLIGGILGGFALILACMVVAVTYWAYKQKNKAYDFKTKLQTLIANGEISDDGGDTALPDEINRADISLIEILGQGNFGEVWKGYLKRIYTGRSNKKKVLTDYVVGVKVAKHHHGSREELATEATVMSRIGSHENVVGLVGVVTRGHPTLLIVTYCEHGALLEYMQSLPGPMDGDTKLRILRDVACGMEHIASRNYVHRDLAARNVFLGAGLEAKVGDFGLARAIMQTRTQANNNDNVENYYRTRKGIFPALWTAPEVMQSLCSTKAGDVWAYGILAVEVFNDGDRPYPGIATTDVYAMVSAGYRLPIPRGCSDAMYSLLLQCWAEDPESRPSFENIMSSSCLGGAQRRTSHVSAAGFNFEEHRKNSPMTKQRGTAEYEYHGLEAPGAQNDQFLNGGVTEYDYSHVSTV